MFNVNINSKNKNVKLENVSFKDQNPSYDYSVAALNDETFRVADRDDADLGNFFSRPIKIQEFQWATSTTIFQTFNPWKDYFENQRVINRVTNFGLMRAKLCIKVVINGNGFHFGRLIMSYTPLRNLDQFTVNRAFISQDVIGASQRPHIYLDPTTSSGGSMCLPFFWYDNYLEVPDMEWQDMGEMELHAMQPLQHANGATDSVTISVFAWAEDVTLAVPTSAEPGALVAQMGMEDFTTGNSDVKQAYREFRGESPAPRKKREGPREGVRIITDSFIVCDYPYYSISISQLTFDELQFLAAELHTIIDKKGLGNRPYRAHMGMEDEYGKGPVSRPASAVARAAGMLTQVPYIGAYARATSIAASAVSTVATVFGYSRPNVISAIQSYKPTYMGNLANTNVEDSCVKLSVDAKQELTVDPTTVGLAPTDEMTINSIACRESYLTSFPWLVSATSEDMLWEALVSPVMWDVNAAPTPPEIHWTSCGFAALPFRNWFGSMKYRFQIVSSNYHKGRLKIVYDPHGFQSNEYNTNYTYIVDIAEDKDFTVQIGWGSDKPYCVVGAPGVSLAGAVITPTSVPFSTVPTPTVPGNLANGVIRVYIVNELTVPNSIAPNDIAVNVFVSAGEDMQFRNPGNLIDEYQYFAQMGMEGNVDGDVDATDEPNKPMAQNTDHQMLNTVYNDNYDMVFFGETITSFRQLLKRYSLHTCELPPGGGLIIYRNSKSMFPFYKGLAPGAITNSNGVTYNYAKSTLMNYLTPAYGAWRGGIRYKIMSTDPNNTMMNGFLGVTREPVVTGYSENTETYPALAGAKAFLMRIRRSTLAGSIFTPLRVNPVVEVEMPFQANARFGIGKKADYTTSKSFTISNMITEYSKDLVGQSRPHIDYYVAAGEDFSLFFYLGPPIMYHGVVPP